MSTADAAAAVPAGGWVRRNWLLLLLATVGALAGWLGVAVQRVRDTAARLTSQ